MGLEWGIISNNMNIDDKHFESLNSVTASYYLLSKVRHAETFYKHTHSAQSWLSFKSVKNHYHNLILTAKKKFYSNLVSSSATNPRRLWQTVNKLLHRKATSPLPTSSSSVPLPDRFASFFADKISKLHLSLSSHPAMASPHCPSPPTSPPGFSTFRPASESEVPSQLSQQAM